MGIIGRRVLGLLRRSMAVVVLAAALLLQAIWPAAASAAEIVDSGICGTCPWSLDSEGTLSIGPGKLASKSLRSEWPWYDCRDQIVAVKTLGTVQTGSSISELFFECANLKAVDLSNWDTSSLRQLCIFGSSGPSTGYTFSGPFYGCSSIVTLDLSGWDVSRVERADCLFEGLSALKNLDLSGWDTASLTSTHKMFSGCSSLESLDLSNWNTSSVVDMRYMFHGCSSLESLNLSGWNTSSVNVFDYMFYGCSSLEALDVSHFDTSAVTGVTTNPTGEITYYLQGMSSMFSGCSSLESLDVSSFDVSMVKGMTDMFRGCSSLNSLNLGDWQTADVKNMAGMFSNCGNLSSLDLSSFDTSSVTNMAGMFEGCSSLNSLNLGGWRTADVKYMQCMFSNCSNLSSVDLSGLDTSSVTNMNSMFEGCSSLTTIEVSNIWDVSAVTVSFSMFYKCTSLVGGNGTAYNASHTDASYAHIDTPGNPGYLTEANHSAGDDERDLSKAQIYINGEHSDGNVKVQWSEGKTEPRISVWLQSDEPFGKELLEGTDYTITFSDNTMPGKAKVTITGGGNYTGSKTVDFVIEKPSDYLRYSIDDVYAFENKSMLIPLDYCRYFYGDFWGRELYFADFGGSGVCYGMATTAAASASYERPKASDYRITVDEKSTFATRLRDVGPNWWSNYNPYSPSVEGLSGWSTYTGIEHLSVKDYIEFGQISQFDWRISEEEAANVDKLKELVSAVENNIYSDGEPVMIGISKEINKEYVGHELWAVGCATRLAETVIYVYDCNYPDEFREITINGSRWSYDTGSWGIWSTDNGAHIDFSTPANLLPEQFARSGKWTDPYEVDEETKKRVLLRSSDPIVITLPNGRRVVLDYEHFKRGDNDIIRCSGKSILPGGRISDNDEMYWINEGGTISLSTATDGGHFSLSSATGTTSARVEAESILTFEITGDESYRSASIKQENKSRFEIEYIDHDEDGLATITISGVGSNIITGQSDTGVEVAGASELAIHTSDNQSTYVADLDENLTYLITPGDENTPPEVVGEEGGESSPVFDQAVVYVAAGSAHSAAILEDGSLWTWGWNSSGQLGDGTYEDKLTPVKVMDDVVSVDLGTEHSAAIKSDGSLWMWGRNKYGSLGDGTTTSRPSPVKVMDGVSQVSCGNGTTAALKDDGTLWVWGFVGLDGLGIGEPESLYDYLSQPVQLASGVSSVSMGGTASSYVTTSGELFAWGAGATTGSVGTGSKENVYEPVKILDGVASVSMGATSAAVKTDGSLWIWGYQPGVYEPTKVLDGVSSVSSGFNYIIAQMQDGSLQTYGVNDHGQLGNGSKGSPSTSFSKVCDGMVMSDAGDSFGISVDSSGSLYTWGYNKNGQLGNGSTDDVTKVTATAIGSGAPITQASTVDISSATITGVSDVPYSGGHLTQPVVVTLGGNTLEEGWDYSVDYADNTEVGKASVIIKGRGIYTGTATASFNVTAVDIGEATVSAIEEQTYTGKKIEPSPVVTYNGMRLLPGTDYTLSYENNVEAGTATVTVTGRDNFTGAVTTTFKIVRATPSTVSVYRLYNTKTSEHLWTTSASEYRQLPVITGGDWRQEGVAWEAPDGEGTPVYRLYNRAMGDHYYSMDEGEIRALTTRHGWVVDNGGEPAFWSANEADPGAIGLYCVYNGRLRKGQHHFTASAAERDFLVSRAGWRYEKVAFYGFAKEN